MVVYSQIDIIKQGSQLPSEILLRHCEILSNSSQRMASAIEKFRRFATNDSVPQDYNLKEELEFLGEIFEQKWKLKNHRFSIEGDGLNRLHRCDIAKLVQTLLELAHYFFRQFDETSLDIQIFGDFENEHQILRVFVKDLMHQKLLSVEKLSVDPKDLFSFQLNNQRAIEINLTNA